MKNLENEFNNELEKLKSAYDEKLESIKERIVNLKKIYELSPER